MLSLSLEEEATSYEEDNLYSWYACFNYHDRGCDVSGSTGLHLGIDLAVMPDVCVVKVMLMVKEPFRWAK